MMSRPDLLERVQLLPEASQQYVFQILQQRELKFTENNNGIFFNLTQCDDPTVWLALQRVVDQQSALQKENTERESRMKEMQEMLRKGERKVDGGEAESDMSPVPKTAPTKKARGKTVHLPDAPIRSKHDILAMLAK